MISGVITAVLLLAFFGIVAWAYSARRSDDFEHAARAPLADEHPAPPCCDGREHVR